MNALDEKCSELSAFVSINGGSVAQVGTRTGTKMTRERQRTAALEKSLPPGITVGEWSGDRRKKFYVRFGPDRVVESFELESDRNDRASRLAELQHKEGSSALDYDPRLYKWLVTFLDRTKATPAELEILWEKRAKVAALTVEKACERYKELRLSEDLSDGTDSFRQIKLHLARLCAKFGLWKLSDITTDNLREWFESLANPETREPFDKVTIRNHRKNVNTFFKRCVDEEWIQKNPCAKVKPPKVRLKDKPPMAVKDLFALLKANRDEPVAGRLALEIFGSMRCSSVARAKGMWILWDLKGIRMPGSDEEGEEHLHKSGKSIFRQGHPDVLWKWLEHSKETMWSITESMYPLRKGQAFIRAGVKNPGNGLRRSCASYQLAITKSAGPVARLMQHKHTSTTEIYDGQATEQDAKLFMAMTPDAVLLSWEEFCQLKSPKPETK